MFSEPHSSGSARRELSGVILAGGKSSRMGGVDKAFLTVDGLPVVERTIRLFQGCFAQTIVVTNSPEKYRKFGDAELTGDLFPNLGPLAGIHAGLSLARFPYAFVAACDMPFLQRESIEHVIRCVTNQDAVIPVWDGDIEPLHAVYRDSPPLRDREGPTRINSVDSRLPA